MDTPRTTLEKFGITRSSQSSSSATPSAPATSLATPSPLPGVDSSPVAAHSRSGAPREKSSSRFTICPSCGESIPAFRISSHIETCAIDEECTDGQPRSKRKAPQGNRAQIAERDKKFRKIGPEQCQGVAPCTSGGALARESEEAMSSQSLRHSAPPAQSSSHIPLAEVLRPSSLGDVVGQEKALSGPSAILPSMACGKMLTSIILWGPPGSGKTTLARIIATRSDSFFAACSAVTSKVADVREVIHAAKGRKKLSGRSTILFIDEIHRFNKLQQDALLPHVENGTVTLIGATTENPSFECNAALLSRCHIIVLEKLSQEALMILLRRGVEEMERRHRVNIRVEDDSLKHIARVGDGDGRSALNILERIISVSVSERKPLLCQASTGAEDKALDEDLNIKFASVLSAINKQAFLYDKDGEEHYNIISALHKSMRGSDANAALYWLARMLDSGEKPEYIARRILRFATEDIGMADPQAVLQGVAAFQTCQMLGMPECNTALAMAVVYMAKAPKSIAVYSAIKKAQAAVRELPNAPVPFSIRNAPTKQMKDLGYGNGYKYTPDFVKEGLDATQEFLPPELSHLKFYEEDDECAHGH